MKYPNLEIMVKFIYLFIFPKAVEPALFLST